MDWMDLIGSLATICIICNYEVSRKGASDQNKPSYPNTTTGSHAILFQALKRGCLILWFWNAYMWTTIVTSSLYHISITLFKMHIFSPCPSIIKLLLVVCINIISFPFTAKHVIFIQYMCFIPPCRWGRAYSATSTVVWKRDK